MLSLIDHVDLFSSLLDPYLLVGGQMFRARMHLHLISI